MFPCRCLCLKNCQNVKQFLTPGSFRGKQFWKEDSKESTKRCLKGQMMDYIVVQLPKGIRKLVDVVEVAKLTEGKVRMRYGGSIAFSYFFKPTLIFPRS